MTVHEKSADLQLLQPPPSLHSPWGVTAWMFKRTQRPLRSSLPGFWYTCYTLMSSVTMKASHHIYNFLLI